VDPAVHDGHIQTRRQLRPRETAGGLAGAVPPHRGVDGGGDRCVSDGGGLCRVGGRLESMGRLSVVDGPRIVKGHVLYSSSLEVVVPKERSCGEEEGLERG